MNQVISHRHVALVQPLQNVCFGKALLGQHLFKSMRSVCTDANADGAKDSSKKNNPANQNEELSLVLRKSNQGSSLSCYPVSDDSEEP